MSTKAKVKIFTGIAVLLAIVVAAVAYCGRERQIPTDIGCFPHIKRICVGGEYFTFDEDTRRGEAPHRATFPKRNLYIVFLHLLQSTTKQPSDGGLFCCDRKISRVL